MAGTWFGVELKEKAVLHGTDGEMDGQRYFNCPKGTKMAGTWFGVELKEKAVL